MEKMKVYGKKIYYENMIYTTDQKCCFSWSHIEDQKNVNVKKRSEQANNKEKNIGSGPAAVSNG